jgi:hypothetical protein
MNKKLLKLEIIGFIFVSVIGTLQHFIFEWTNENILVAMFCPVNESPWEHLKLLFFPFLFYTLYMAIKLKNDKFNVYFANYIGLLFGMWATLSYYYTFNGMIGGNNEWVNISSFFVGVAIMFIISYFLINNSVGRGTPNYLAFAMIIVTAIVFFIFTFAPPLIPLFQDPQNLVYGI